VNSTDALIPRNNPTSIGNVTRFITVANPPAAPEAAPDIVEATASAESTGVPSGLSEPALQGAPNGTGVPHFLVDRRKHVEGNSGQTKSLFDHLMEQNHRSHRKVLTAIDKVLVDLRLDDELLDSLLIR
jgi:hypothetical protein